VGVCVVWNEQTKQDVVKENNRQNMKEENQKEKRVICQKNALIKQST
jgi:hypothetical protein